MEKKELLKELVKEFEKLKKDLNFKSEFNEIDKEFSIKDFVLEEGFIRENFFIQFSSRIVELFRNWASYLNSLLLPNPSFMIHQTEAKLFCSEKDRKEIWENIKKCMYISSKHSLISVNKNLKMQGEFIDESLVYWKKDIKPFIEKVMQKVYVAWKE